MYPQIINEINSLVWAIMPEKMEMIMKVLASRMDGGPHVDYEAAAQRQTRTAGSKVVVLPMDGTMSQRASLMTEHSGMLSTDSIGKQIDLLANDPSVKSIILDVNSPGGSVFGLKELTSKIRSASSKKRVIAVSNSMMASAAYWTASAATKTFAAPGSQVGSIGAIAVHIDQSQAMEEAGVKYTFITAGKYKALGNSAEPLTADAESYLQDQVDQYYSMFIEDVAANRKVSKSKVKEQYGQGKVLSAKDALSVGMVDGIRTLEDVIGMELRRNSR
jgi:signal peptide peptidase SppA